MQCSNTVNTIRKGIFVRWLVQSSWWSDVYAMSYEAKNRRWLSISGELYEKEEARCEDRSIWKSEVVIMSCRRCVVASRCYRPMCSSLCAWIRYIAFFVSTQGRRRTDMGLCFRPDAQLFTDNTVSTLGPYLFLLIQFSRHKLPPVLCLELTPQMLDCQSFCTFLMDKEMIFWRYSL